MAAPAGTAAFHLAPQGDGRTLVEVVGSLEDAGLARWAGLLKGAFVEGRHRIALDLRGCRAIGPHCLEALLAASAVMRAAGGQVGVVSLRGSPMEGVLRAHEQDLPAYPSVRLALLAPYETP
jgi:anti-anti-sigma regulatory factor